MDLKISMFVKRKKWRCGHGHMREWDGRNEVDTVVMVGKKGKIAYRGRKRKKEEGISVPDFREKHVSVIG